jgi:ribosomal protein S18 acetylase RimI-like enzyme
MPGFRPAVTADAESILVLQRAFYAEDGYPFFETDARTVLTHLLGEPSLGRVWVATDGPAVIAYVVLTLSYSLEYRGRDAFIDELYVAQTHRGSGLGAQALQLAQSACAEQGVLVLHLEVERSKDRAIAWYRRHGFADRNRFLLTKDLSPRERP